MPALLVTGRPGSGKTSLVRRALEDVRPAPSGFYTRRAADGRRTGFEVVTLEGNAAILAGVRIKGRYRVGRYGVDNDALERPGVPAIVGARVAGARGQPARDRPLAE
jgi:nucleoside-triphosphatase